MTASPQTTRRTTQRMPRRGLLYVALCGLATLALPAAGFVPAHRVKTTSFLRMGPPQPPKEPPVDLLSDKDSLFFMGDDPQPPSSLNEPQKPSLDWSDFPTTSLEDECTSRGLSVTGDRDALVERLRKDDEEKSVSYVLGRGAARAVQDGVTDLAEKDLVKGVEAGTVSSAALAAAAVVGAKGGGLATAGVAASVTAYTALVPGTAGDVVRSVGSFLFNMTGAANTPAGDVSWQEMTGKLQEQFKNAKIGRLPSSSKTPAVMESTAVLEKKEAVDVEETEESLKEALAEKAAEKEKARLAAEAEEERLRQEKEQEEARVVAEAEEQRLKEEEEARVAAEAEAQRLKEEEEARVAAEAEEQRKEEEEAREVAEAEEQRLKEEEEARAIAQVEEQRVKKEEEAETEEQWLKEELEKEEDEARVKAEAEEQNLQQVTEEAPHVAVESDEQWLQRELEKEEAAAVAAAELQLDVEEATATGVELEEEIQLAAEEKRLSEEQRMADETKLAEELVLAEEARVDSEKSDVQDVDALLDMDGDLTFGDIDLEALEEVIALQSEGGALDTMSGDLGLDDLVDDSDDGSDLALFGDGWDAQTKVDSSTPSADKRADWDVAGEVAAALGTGWDDREQPDDLVLDDIDEIDMAALAEAALSAVDSFEQEVDDWVPDVTSEKTAVDWSKLTVPKLKEELRSRGLSLVGKKQDLVARLEAAGDGIAEGVEIPGSAAWSTLTVPKLKAELRSRGLPATGKKSVLVATLEESDANGYTVAETGSDSDEIWEEASVPDFASMTVTELKDELRKRGLSVSGRKADLIARLS